MANYKARAQGDTYSKLRIQLIQKGDGWTPHPFCGTGISYTVSGSAGCGVLGRRMLHTDSMNTTTTPSPRIILSAESIIRQNANAENTRYSTLYILYTNSMIPHTKYDLSYSTVSGSSSGSGSGVAA